MKYDVFISYSSKDQKVAEGICGFLESNSYRCFVAYRDIPRGVVWAGAIADAIDESQMMVVVFSKDFNISPQTDREIELAAENNIPILTYRITDDKFTGAKKFYLKNLNWIDAFPNPEHHFGKLLDSISKLIGRYTNEDDDYKQFHLDDIVLGVTQKEDLKGVDFDDYKGCEISFQNDIVSRFCTLSDTKSAPILFSLIWGSHVDAPSLFSYNYIWNNLKEKGFVIDEMPKIEISSLYFTSEVSFEACISKTTASYICKLKFYNSSIGFMHNRLIHKSLEEMKESTGTLSEIEIIRR